MSAAEGRDGTALWRAIEELTPWSLFIARALGGDGSELARILRGVAEAPRPLPADVLRFLADLLEGKAKLKRRKKLTIIAKRRKRLSPEAAVVRAVDAEMRELGCLRNKTLRNALTKRIARIYGTTPEAVRRYLRNSKKQRG